MDNDGRLHKLESVISECASALSEISEALQSGATNGNEIGAALAEIAALLEQRDDKPMADVAAAIRELRLEIPAPQVTVKNEISVQPPAVENHIHTDAPVIHNHVKTEAPVVQVMEQPKVLVDYEVTSVKYDQAGRFTGMRMRAIPQAK